MWKMKNANVRLDNGLGPKLSSYHLAFFLNIFNYYEAEVFLYSRFEHILWTKPLKHSPKYGDILKTRL